MKFKYDGFYQTGNVVGPEYYEQIKQTIPNIEDKLYSERSILGFKYSGKKPYGMWTKKLGNKIIRVRITRPPAFANPSPNDYLVQFYKGVDDDTMKEYYSYSVIAHSLDDAMYKAVTLMDYGMKTLKK